ncbi:hypothetical protein CHU92_01415 [Flavobacterium cyanobacteriorum]|uniref:Ester cyclase n=1 Tax=Flavobacterium cyanobacteriorum TaxID=2022802 RepID=A0A255ZYK2_9FLAO|nr:ester cyclase [Flavobacterium cyanobacteriorum]OYQ46492.1 hypothetical protein CHU92_01415 [Flavobacterium cyanobacteriorum]
MSQNNSITRELYDAFQKNELHRWDAIISKDVKTTSPASYGVIEGIELLKAWGAEFLNSLEPQVDLVDEFDGGERAFISVCLYWKHTKPFFGIPPTGREGTSIETFILTVKDGKITEFKVADQTLDLAIYLWQKGMPAEHNARPEPIVAGIVRR